MHVMPCFSCMYMHAWQPEAAAVEAPMDQALGPEAWLKLIDSCMHECVKLRVCLQDIPPLPRAAKVAKKE